MTTAAASNFVKSPYATLRTMVWEDNPTLHVTDLFSWLDKRFPGKDLNKKLNDTFHRWGRRQSLDPKSPDYHSFTLDKMGTEQMDKVLLEALSPQELALLEKEHLPQLLSLGKHPNVATSEAAKISPAAQQLAKRTQEAKEAIHLAALEKYGKSLDKPRQVLMQQAIDSATFTTDKLDIIHVEGCKAGTPEEVMEQLFQKAHNMTDAEIAAGAKLHLPSKGVAAAQSVVDAQRGNLTAWQKTTAQFNKVTNNSFVGASKTKIALKSSSIAVGSAIMLHGTAKLLHPGTDAQGKPLPRHIAKEVTKIAGGVGLVILGARAGGRSL